MANKRIKDLTEKNVLASGDYFPIDNSTDGTKKVNSSKILDPISHVQGEVSGSGDSYSSSKSYAKGDLVIHDNVLYVCTSACTSGSWATNSSHFTATTLASEVTDVKQTLETEINKKHSIWKEPTNPISIFSIISDDTNYPTGYIYASTADKISNGEDTLETLLNTSIYNVVEISKYTRYHISIKIFDCRYEIAKFFTAFCASNYTNIIFIVINPSATPTVEKIKVTKAT